MQTQYVTSKSKPPRCRKLAIIFGVILGLALITIADLHEYSVYADSPKAQATKEYPPYPDVWHFIPPIQKRLLSFLEAPSGDVLVSSHIIFGSPHTSSYISIFTSREYGYRTSREWLDNGFHYIKRFYGEFETATGYTVNTGFEPIGAKCKNVLGSYIRIDDGETAKEYRVLYILPHAEKIIGNNCEGSVDYSARVVSLSFAFRTLDDDTLLASSRHLILRFTPNMTSPASIIGKTLFFVERQLDPYFELNLPYPDNHTRITDQEIWLKYLEVIRGNEQ